jgi:predicted transcriptional regulator
VTRPSSRISPLELIRSDSGEAIARMQSASSYLRSLFKGQPQLQNMNQAQERGMER